MTVYRIFYVYEGGKWYKDVDFSMAGSPQKAIDKHIASIPEFLRCHIEGIGIIATTNPQEIYDRGKPVK